MGHAERRGRHSHAPRGNENIVGLPRRSASSDLLSAGRGCSRSHAPRGNACLDAPRRVT